MNSLHTTTESSPARPASISPWRFCTIISQAHSHRPELRSAAVRLQAARASLRARPNPDSMVEAKVAVLETLALLKTVAVSRGLEPRFERYVEARLAERGSVVGLNGCLLRLQCVLRALEPMTYSSRICDLFSRKLSYFRTLFQICV